MKRNSFTLGCLAASALAVASLGSCSKQQEAMQAPAPSLQVVTIEPVTSQLFKSYPAILKGKTDIEIRPQVSGFITKVHVDEGQRVHKGQALFTIDQVQYQAAVDQAIAQVNSARTAVANAKITADNNKALYDRNIISENAWQTADNQLRQAKAQLAQAEAALTSAKKNMSYTVVTAPSDGVVGSIPSREGSLASPSSMTPLTTISDNSEMYAYFSLNEKDILDMTDGGTISVNEALKTIPAVTLVLTDGTQYPIEGKVATISGVIDNSTGAASVRALFNNPSGMLRSGNTGQINIPVTTENAIVIPQKATFEVQNLKYVFTLNDSNKTVNTPIEVLSLNDGKNYVVTSGLKPGDRVVTEGIGTTVRADMKVNPVDAKAAEQQAQTAQQAK